MLKQLRRLGFFRKRNRPKVAGALRSMSLYNAGILAVVGPEVDPDRVTASLRDEAGRTLHAASRPTGLVAAAGQSSLAFPLPAELFGREAVWRLSVTSPDGASGSELVRVGAGRYAGGVDGVENNCVVGWVSPLFDAADVIVSLLADGLPMARVRPDEMRPELLTGSRAGGWNGFRIPLPSGLFDGSSHSLEVMVGDGAIWREAWRSDLKLNIDNVEPDRLTGWIFDAAARDVPGVVRLFDGNREVARAPTGYRVDLQRIFGREAAAFALTEIAIEPGQVLVFGPDDAGRVIGHVVEDALRDRVSTFRAQARADLLRAHDPAESRDARVRRREGAIAAARRNPERRLALAPGPAPSARPAVPPLPPATWQLAATPPVCAILPVYKGLADLRVCLASLLPQIEAGRTRLVAIDDASPEPGIAEYLRTLTGRPGVTMLTNERNLGFIGSVNRGFAALRPGEDAVIVNADTELAPRTLAKLAAHCHARPGIASVTPMSNNATILSFPGSPRPNTPVLRLGATALDAAFEALGAAPVEIPTAVGFCMYVKREALDEVGPFSPEWGRGYCEEVDWSLAARDLGWVHLAAQDCFVLHEGSVSFGVKERSEILAVNHARLEAKYPEYLDEVREVIRGDPFGGLRRRVLARLLSERFTRLTLHVMHGMGGGTKRYVSDLCALPRDPDHEVAVLTPAEGEFGTERLRIAFDKAEAWTEIAPGEFDAFLAEFEQAGLAIRLHVNSRLALPEAVLDTIASGRRPFDVMLHDYQWYCPKVHLTDERVFYCGEPPPEICQICVRHEQTHDFRDHNPVIQTNIHDWIAYNHRLLERADRLLAPSRDTADRYARRLGLDGIVVLPHPEAPGGAPARLPLPQTGALRIAMVGAIGHHKGFDLVVRVAELAAARRLPIYFRVIGYTPDGDRLARLPNADVTGPYEPEELGGLLDAFAPTFVLLPSVWPETYSYVLSEVWAAGYPVVAFDFGAQAERIRATGGGALIPPTRDASEMLEALLAIWKEGGASTPGALTGWKGSLEAYSAVTS